MVTLYGISSCDTVRKARSWLDHNEVNHHLHDFRKDGTATDLVSAWLRYVPAEQLINKRRTTWRELPEADRSRADGQLVGLLVEHPTLIRRPVLEADGHPPELGFKAARYEQTLEKA